METVRRPSVELWEEIIKNCEHATFFHSPIWTKVLEKTYPHYSNATVSFTFNTGNRAIFPLVAEQSKGILFKKAKHKSMALGVYGGMLAERRLAPEETGSIFEYLTSIDIKDLKVVENPLENYDFPENFVAKSLFTHIVSLNADFEQLRKRFSRGQKSNIKQAEKKGITVRLANSLEDYEQYYTIYQETIKRWGESVGSQDIKLWLAEKQRKIVAGVLTLYSNYTILYWHGCSLKEYFDHYPNNLLHMEIIKDGCIKGYKSYDLNPSGGHQGVVKFKESFSARRVDFKTYHWKKH